MIYGYLRVSSDEQDVNSQKQGVVKFAEAREWKIDEYITDEGVSGGKDPDIPSHPYCRKCLDKEKLKAMIGAFGEEQGKEFFNVWNAIKRKGIESCHIKMKKEKEIIKN